MVGKYVDAVFINLIDKNDYFPINDQNGNLIIRDDFKILHRYMNGTNIIVDLLNGDLLCAEEIKSKLEADTQLLFANSSRGNFYLYTVFVFQSQPDKEKLDIINSKQDEEQKGFKSISCISVNLSSGEIMKHFKVPPTTYGLDKVLDEIMISNRYQYEPLPDVNELINRKLEGFKVDFKARVPVVTYILLAVNIAVFLLLNLYANILSSNPPVDYILNYEKYGSLYNYLLYNYGAQVSIFIKAGEFWRLVTPIFLHASTIHLLSNSYFLFIIGSMVEKMYGSKKFIFVYMIAGIIGSIVSFNFSTGYSVGASGALMGMLGALLYYGIENPAQFKRYFGFNVVANIVINAVFGFSTKGIDNYAHFGGLVGGFLASGIVGLGKARNKYFNKYTASVLTVLTVAAGLFYGFNK